MVNPQTFPQFQQLCKSIRDRQVVLLECESLSDGGKAMLVCAIHPVNDTLMEVQPLARLLDPGFGSLVIPQPPAAEAWSPDRN